MQLPLLGILSLSGYFFVKDKTDIRDQNLLIVKTMYRVFFLLVPPKKF